MPINNKIYDIHANGWWDENNFLHTLKTGINPARFQYFREIITVHNREPSSLSVLDIGCGGGILSEDFAKINNKVTGIDPSFSSLRTAKNHAQLEQLQINYLSGSAENLPCYQDSFDIVLCCDVLEHVTDLNNAIQETSRVLKPGGIFFFDTINKTWTSFIETIFIAQEFPPTRFFEPGSHDWRQFIPPSVLKKLLIKNKLRLVDVQGLQAGISPLLTLTEILRLKHGKSNFAEFGKRLNFKLSKNLSGSYIGYAIKNN